MSDRKQPTNKSLGLTDNVILSPTFNNTKTRFKTIDSDVPYAYHFVGSNQVAPLYRATLWIRSKGHNECITTYEVGPYLVLEPEGAEPTFWPLYDPVSAKLCQIAWQTLQALELQYETIKHRAKSSPASKVAKRRRTK